MTDTFKAPSIDDDEIARFAADADKWWDRTGPYAPLHHLTRARTTYVREAVISHFKRDPRHLCPLATLSMLDVGCGGGILAEPLARMGASVTAIDPAKENIAVAKAHAATSGLSIDYRALPAEKLVAERMQFDVVIASEVIEHVVEPDAFISLLARLTRPGGLVLISTLNRTLKSFALAKIGAEYILRWLPAGTHDWHKFITPDEMADYAQKAGLEEIERRGMRLDPVKGDWRLSSDTDVNYWFAARRH